MNIVRRAPFADSPLVGQRGASTQRIILAAALEVFGERGFHDTSVELITQRAGCSRPAFYQYFASKEDVFWHLARDLASAIRHVADGLGQVPATLAGVEHVAEWLDRLTDVYLDYRPIFTSFSAAVRGPTEELGDARGISDRIGGAIMASIEMSRRPQGLPALPSVTVSVVLRTINHWNTGLGQIQRRRFITGFAQTLHRMFCGPIEGVNVLSPSHSPSARPPATPIPPRDQQLAEPLRPRGRATRERLLAAGVAVLPERGYHDTRITDIVARADVSHGSFYRYFSTKDALFGVLAERTATTLFELMKAFPCVSDEPALRTWFEEYFESYRVNGGVISVWQEIDFVSSGLGEYSMRVALVVFDRLERIVHTRGFGDHSVDALILLAIMERVPYSVHSLGYTDVDAAIGATMYIVRNGLFGLSDR